MAWLGRSVTAAQYDRFADRQDGARHKKLSGGMAVWTQLGLSELLVLDSKGVYYSVSVTQQCTVGDLWSQLD